MVRAIRGEIASCFLAMIHCELLMLGAAFLARGRTEAHSGRDWVKATKPPIASGLQVSVASHKAWLSMLLPNRACLVLWPGWGMHMPLCMCVLPVGCLRKPGTHHKLLADS